MTECQSTTRDGRMCRMKPKVTIKIEWLGGYSLLDVCSRHLKQWDGNRRFLGIVEKEEVEC